MIQYLLSILLLGKSGVLSLNILVVHPIYAGSHVLTIHTLSKELIARGHSVTTFKYKDNKLPNLDYGPRHTMIQRSLNNTGHRFPFVTKGEEAQFRLPLEVIWSQGTNLMWTIWQMVVGDKILMEEFCGQVLKPSLVEELLDEKFDVAIIDLMFNECGLALANQLELPSVGYWAFSFASGVQEFTTMGAPPSFVPTMMSRMGQKMNFIDRSVNLVFKLMSHLYMSYHGSVIDAILKDQLPTSPSSSELLSNLSGLLINTDYILDYARPQPPSFINVGGIQIKSDPGSIPQDMLSFIEGAQEGVVLFTMGFIFDPTAVPPSSIQRIMEVFGRLPQRVVMKLESTQWAAAAPSNVMVVPWVPQQAVLAHQNVRLFITHCGMHGVLEAIHYKVPMVGMPVFIDQGDVLTRMEEAGIAVGVSKEASSEELQHAIREVRDNPQYKQKISKLSEIFKDKKIHPMELASSLVEFIGRTGGANHLKVQSGHLNIIQYYSIDCFIFLFALLLLCLCVSFLLTKTFVLSCLVSSTSKYGKLE